MEESRYENYDQERDTDINSQRFNVGDQKNLTNNAQIEQDDFVSDEAEQTRKSKRKRHKNIDEETKLANEAYNRDLHEQRYKRLMHLLDRSQFYASYIVNKICKTEEKSLSKLQKKEKVQITDENTPPSNKIKPKRKPDYDIRDYISKDVQHKIKAKRMNSNLSEEQIEEEVNTDSDTEVKETVRDESTKLKYFTGVLRNYQAEGLQWLKVLYENGLNGILADEMGLGKTIQVIALFCHLIEKQQDGPYLIVAPLSTIPNWIIEFERFAPKLPIVVLHGNAQERVDLCRKIKQKHFISGNYRTQPVVLTTYEMPAYEIKFLKTQKWRYLVIDEGHRIKNYKCQLVQILQSLDSMNRLLLTGTPLQNNLAELWSLLNFLLPEIFDDLAVFESWFDVTELQGEERTQKILKQEEEKRILSTLREILKPFMLRREKSDVCFDIPGKKEVIVYVPLTELQRDLYRGVLNRDIHTMTKMEETPLVLPLVDGKRPKRKCVLRQSQTKYYEERSRSSSPQSNEELDVSSEKSTEPNTVENTLAMWQQYTDVTDRNRNFLVRIQFRNTMSMYKRIVNHPYLVHCPLDSTGLPQIDEDFVKVAGKLLTLDAMLPKLKQRGHKILLFSTMTLLLDLLEDYLTLRNHIYVRLDGSTTIDIRKENITKFNTNPDIFIFLISTRAGGVGINLAAADTVILYDSDWNPQADLQAMARCHRIGQTRPVVIYRFCTRGTIDEAIINRGEGKRMLEKLVISKEAKSLTICNKDSLLELKQFLESKDCQIASSENEVFTEEELNKLLDRSDI